MVTEHEGGLNLGCDALPEGRYDSHSVSSLSDIYLTMTGDPKDSPSLFPMVIEEPSSSTREPRSSDNLGILVDTNGSECRCFPLGGCSHTGKDQRKKNCTLPRLLPMLCHGNRMLFFGLVAALVVIAIVAVTIYQCTVKSEEEIPINYNDNGHDLVVLGRGTVVKDILPAALNLTTEGEIAVLKTSLVQSLDYKMKTLVDKTKFRELYTGFHIVQLNLEYGTFEYALVFHGVEEDNFMLDLQSEIVRLLDASSAMEFSVLKMDLTSLQLYHHTTHTTTELPNSAIFIPLCMAGHYNRTCYPNVLHHQSQFMAMTAGLANIQMYFSRCSDSLHVFWCSIFAPDCTTGTPLPPCRSLCQAVLTDCPNLRSEVESLIAGGCSSLPDSNTLSCTDLPPISPDTETGDISRRCKEVEVEECRSLGFTLTPRSGNLLGQRAASSLHWWQVLQFISSNSQCSPHLLAFGCSIFYPKCIEDDSSTMNLAYEPEAVGPCETFCAAVERDCAFFFSLLEMEFLSDFNCSNHLPHTNQLTCVGAELSVDDSTDVKCREDQFKCDARSCVSAKWICDGRVDCSNGNDEKQCATCPEQTTFRCDNGLCLPLQSRCDGRSDCQHGEDEDDCIRISTEGGVEGVIQIYNSMSQYWESVCLPEQPDSLNESLCNLNRFTIFKSYEKWNDANGTLVRFLRHSSNCTQYRQTTIQCNYSDCANGLLLDDVSRLFDSPRFGESLNEGDWPWLVSLHGGHRQAFYCGGFLVSDQWVVTAAHCVGGLTEKADWTIVAGQSRRTSAYSSSRQERTVSQLVIYPRYSREKEDDIALIRLDRPVQFGSQVRRLCLPDNTYQPTVGQACYVGGWGKTSNSDLDFPEGLRLRRLTVEPVTQCVEFMRNALADDEQHRILCTTGRLASDVCKGDSGSAVLCESTSPNSAGTRLILAGIVSRGRECGYPNVSSIQTAVGPFTDWIRQEIASTQLSLSSL